MTWTLRALEGADGRWSCRREWSEPGTYDTVALALAHLRVVASGLGSAHLIVESRGGRVKLLGSEPSDHTASGYAGAASPPTSGSNTQCRIDSLMARLRTTRTGD